MTGAYIKESYNTNYKAYMAIDHETQTTRTISHKQHESYIDNTYYKP